VSRVSSLGLTKTPVDVRQRQIGSPGQQPAVEAALALAVLDDHPFPAKTVQVLQDSVDQPAKHVRVGRAAALPLAVEP